MTGNNKREEYQRLENLNRFMQAKAGVGLQRQGG